MKDQEIQDDDDSRASDLWAVVVFAESSVLRTNDWPWKLEFHLRNQTFDDQICRIQLSIRHISFKLTDTTILTTAFDSAHQILPMGDSQ
jgi:hypothetical protein